MLEVRLFGETEVRTAEGRVLGWGDFGGTKPREVLELLVLHRGRVLSKDKLADLLWQGAPPDDAAGTVESYVSLLRRKISPGVPAKTSPIATITGGYRLDASRVTVDLDEVGELLRLAAKSEPRTALTLTRQALQLARGPVLEHAPHAMWARSTRTTWTHRLATAAVRAAETALELGDVDCALKLARWALRADRLAEDAWRVLMRAHEAAGRRAEALRAYGACRTRLADALGVEPSPPTRELFHAMLETDAHDVSLDPARAELDHAVAAVLSLVQHAHRPRGDPAAYVPCTPQVNVLLDLLRRAGVAV